MPKVSIILPTYNRAYILNQAIDSVLAQSFTDWELIIVDDGSTDDTREFVSHYIVCDPRIRYISQENAGACVARNNGMEHALGDIIVYLDSDDLFFPEYLSTLIECLKKNKSIVFGATNHVRRIILENDTHEVLAEQEPFIAFTSTPTLEDFYHWRVKTTSSGIFHVRKIRDEGFRWDRNIKRFQDWDFIMSIGVGYPENFYVIPEPMVLYRQVYGGDGMCSQATYTDWAHGFQAMYQKHKDDPLLRGQTWYPERVEKYTRLQKLVDEGKEPSPVYKYFGDYLEKQKVLTT